MLRLIVGLCTCLVLLGPAHAQEFERPDPESQNPAERGAYVLRAAGCVACHTDFEGVGPHLAGGSAIETPFGSFYAPNITMDPTHGIGDWSYADFSRAMRWGIAPDGAHYYPAFPFASYTGMSDQDMEDLWAYLQSVPPAARPNEPHSLSFPYGIRPINAGWKFLFFEPGARIHQSDQSEEWNRGAYLVETLGHCGTCHTPRNFLGASRVGLAMAGVPKSEGSSTIPNITPDDTGIGDWSIGDITYLLRMGFTPEGDDVQGTMGEVVSHNTSYLTDHDLKAMAVYLQGLTPIPNDVRPPSELEENDTIDDW